MYKDQSPFTKPSLLSNPHYKITVATATNPPPILNSPSRHEPLLPNPNASPIFPSSFLAPARLMLTMVSWLRTRRRRCFFLLLCSPILIPFLCATFPLICLAEICFRICWRSSGGKAAAAAQEDEENRLRQCEEAPCGEGEGRGGGLLQRYLEDQLALVGSVYDCGDDFDDHDNQDLDLDGRTPLLS
ncbi:hypothetical protein ERO13_D05G288000v2 [Gossypium hirsutum]|uniref:Uncharacterized protein n=6 Tax=Gossypium TaxID=3633 RepID=A0A1U8J8T1_GOSHI|nr:uncharacterized protein LOC105770680 [Gossypium raimondii]XP_016686740.1 uncharacterized protein LOC107904769 [Gossypium hirsutum]KAB2031419.1 hypothetical protein ES319_D05G303200v1 [Gossypium barbadense]TYG70517.1 hypothetical protein ES288_D05G320300v1 [Gossypium darwinii]TYH73308.1 hypothetical protein ES332_D05G320000v1 [Gossypium tomentosum]TYI83695.1 hypothetical protein E1A91_D05G311200v1 [Gossypium mustelinum]KAG4148478.1 hypothetical protein ERO13_D05G288000v2 [Gossypium hirsutum